MNASRRLKQRLKRTRPLLYASEYKWHLLAGLRQLRQRVQERRVVTLAAAGPFRGHALLSYRIEGFFMRDDDPRLRSHTNYWKTMQIARLLTELGYEVDVISYRNERFRPTKPYRVVIDCRHNLERLAPLLPPDCVKIMEIDTAHILYHDTAEARRLLALQQRRGVTLVPRRYEPPNWCIEHADAGILHGNDFTRQTFQYAGKPLYRVLMPSFVSLPWPADKDWERCRRRYLWFSSYGLVHKGLDLVLEAFAGLTDYHLTVCGPVNREKDFEQAYHKELYETPNIRTVGWVDHGSEQFAALTRECVGMVFVSCSEGGAGSAVDCQQAGLIPIVSREVSLDVHDFGILLEDCSVGAIREAVRKLSALPVEQLMKMSCGAWVLGRRYHTCDAFVASYRSVLTQILGVGEPMLPLMFKG